MVKDRVKHLQERAEKMHHEKRVEKLLDIEVNAIKKRNKIQQAKRFKK